MLHVVMELRSKSDDTAIKTVMLDLTDLEYTELQEVAELINAQDGVFSVEIFTID